MMRLSFDERSMMHLFYQPELAGARTKLYLLAVKNRGDCSCQRT